MKGEGNKERIMAKSRGSSTNQTRSSRGSSQRDLREVSTMKRKGGPVERHGSKDDRSLRKGEEEISVTLSDSPFSDKISESGLGWNSSYQGSDSQSYAGLENLRRNLTPAQFWKLTMGCLETRPRRRKTPEDCRTCKGHEDRNKELMEEAERVDSAQWSRKIFNQLNGMSEELGLQRNRFPWSVHDEKIKESLKCIATPRRVFQQSDAGWSGVYEEEDVEMLETPEEPPFHYLDRYSQEGEDTAWTTGCDDDQVTGWEGREDAQSQYVEKYAKKTKGSAERSRMDDGKDYRMAEGSQETQSGRHRKDKNSEEHGLSSSVNKQNFLDSTSKAGGSRRRIGGSDPVTEIVIPDPRKSWKRPEEKDVDEGYSAQYRLARTKQKSQNNHHVKETNQDSLTPKMSSPSKKKATADHGVLANQDSSKRQISSNHRDKASADRGVINNQELLKQAFLSSLGPSKTPEHRGKLTNQEALKRHVNSNSNDTRETSHSEKKDHANKSGTKEAEVGSWAVSSSRKPEHTPRDTKTGPSLSTAEEPKKALPARAVSSSRKRDPTPGEKNMDTERRDLTRNVEIRSRRTTPSKSTSDPRRKLERHRRGKRQEDEREIKSNQDSVQEEIPRPGPVRTVHRGIETAFASRSNTPHQRYCPNTPRTSGQGPLCQRFKFKEEASKKMLLDQEVSITPKFSPDSHYSRSRSRQQIVSPCKRYVGHEEKSNLFLKKKHEKELKLEQESRESCSETDRHIHSVHRRAQDKMKKPSCKRFVGRNEKSEVYLQRKSEQDNKLVLDSIESRSPKDLHVQSVQRRAHALRTPPCERLKHHETVDSGRTLRRPEPRTQPAKLRHAISATRKEAESPRSCDIFTRHQDESTRSFERSESSRESTPGSRGFWDWKKEERAYDSYREAQRQRESGRPCHRWLEHDEKSRVVLEEARTKLEEALKLFEGGCPLPIEKCQNCQERKKETESLQRWGEIMREQSSISNPHQKKS